MAFTVPLTFDWLKHRLFAAQRILCRQSPVYFIAKNPLLSLATSEHNKDILCPICGFSFADLVTKEGWTVRACSATGFNHIIDNPNFKQWLAETIKNKASDTAIKDNQLSIKLK